MTWDGFLHCWSFQNLLITEGFPSQTASNSPLWCFLCCWLVHNFKQTANTPTKIMWRHCNVYEAWISCILPKLHLSGVKLPTLGILVTYYWLWLLYANKKSLFNIFATWIRSVIYARFNMLWRNDIYLNPAKPVWISLAYWHHSNMMTSSNGNCVNVTGPLGGNPRGPDRWIPLTKDL